MRKINALLLAGLLATPLYGSNPLDAESMLGDPPRAPESVAGLPGGEPRPLDVTSGFSVDTSSREQVREFYNAIYNSPEDTPINSSANVANCFAGTNSAEFSLSTVRRINWFRAMAGIPATVTFDASESAKDQQAAVIMASNGKLQHVGVWTGWTCITPDGTNAAGNSNLDLGNDGPSAITAYISDTGANNSEVGHRRWILYPQTKVMAAGDVPRQGNYNSANATWVFDANLANPRPPTRTPYVSWPPAGYVPYQIVYPRWSFGLSNNYTSVSADFSAATVTMASNGISMSVGIQPYAAGYGENTLVWYPSNLDPSGNEAFPFSGADTVYSITIGNIKLGSATVSYSYNVMVFDPSVPGSDYVPATVSGPSQPSLNIANSFTCTALANTTGYEWLTAQLANGNLTDNSQNGLVNFTIFPAAVYPIITNAPTDSSSCFHLTHLIATPQLLQLKELLFPSNNTTISFKSLLGYATTSETARVQVSKDGGQTWHNLFTETGSGGSGDSAFTPHTISLSAYAGEQVMLRFNYDFNGGSYYPQDDPYIGWCIENIVLANTQQLANQATNFTASTNFAFVPTAKGNNVLQVRGVIFSDFPLDWGPPLVVNAVADSTATVMLGAPVASVSQVQIPFSVSGSVSKFHLLQASQLGGPWTTNATATLATVVAGSSYKFTATRSGATQFYRVQSP